MEITSFRVNVSEDVLVDLKQRLARTRWPDEPADAGWDYGVGLGYLRELTEYWQRQFDWRAQERAMNAFAQFRAEVDGLGIHFIHQRGTGPDPMPLILTHGWPSTFMEMARLIPLLTDPASHGGDARDAFDVVVPSLVGYGFSDRPAWRGPWRTHEYWAKLMAGLGYDRFAAQGGDVGAGVTTNLGRAFPERVIGIHLNSDLAWPSPIPDAAELSPQEREYLARVAQWRDEESGYSHEQRTSPQTLAYGLNDSPAGLAAWIVEKFRAWSDSHGDVESRFTKDALLTTVTTYWVTQTIGSSIRGYYEGAHAPELPRESQRVSVPT
ncbi:MAG TPA: epoxide hydrolase, partial [Ktedonobacterales bacterium]